MNDQKARLRFEYTSEDDMLLLDGKTSSPELQAKIDNIKNIKNHGKDYAFIEKLIKEGNRRGLLKFRGESAVNCEICDRQSHVETYSSGRRAGKYKRTKCKFVPGVSFADDFIIFRGNPRLAICRDCYNRIATELKNLLSKQRFDYSAIMPCKFKKNVKRICYNCKAEIYESEMGMLRTMMGDGYYPGACPKCGTKSLPFGKSHETTDDFRIIEKKE